MNNGEQEAKSFANEQWNLLHRIINISKSQYNLSPSCVLAERGDLENTLSVILGNKVSWIIDSRAFDHMTSCFNLFTYIFHVWE